MATRDTFKALTPTRFADGDVKIYITKICAGTWQCVVEQNGNFSQTGAQTKTKMECFSVLPEVAKQWGFDV